MTYTESYIERFYSTNIRSSAFSWSLPYTETGLGINLWP